MRNRSLGLTLFGSLAIIVSACGGGATPSPSASTAPSTPASTAPSTAPSTEPSAALRPIKV
ncbi:MAG TPA: hypothetical protein VFO73_06145, partial [Candidatus Limnocylindrales bacterium]|nr:hypothetical protein [Candidatus Limnocylindrales bacterium]